MTTTNGSDGERVSRSTTDHPRLALFLPSLRGGGAERMFVQLANGFAKRDYPVDLVLCHASGPYLAEVDPAVRVIDLRARRVASALPALVGYLRTTPPRALLSGLTHANIVALLARKLSGATTRIVVSERNTFSAAGGARLHRLLGTLMRWTYPGAARITAVSAGVASDLAAHLGISSDEIEVLHNPVVTPDLLRAAEQPVVHPWLEVGRGPLILGVGRLAPQKRFDVLIRAFARVRADRPARLAILGEGPLRRELEELAARLGVAEDVLLPGFQSNPFAWMRRARLFVLSSAWEGLPGALIQAMACGTPVVSTDCPSGPSEILEGGKWGNLVPIGDDVAMSRAIIGVLDDAQLPDVRRRALDFGAEVAIDRHLEVLVAD